MTDEPLVTREEAIALINSELGIPVKKRRLDRAAIKGTGPEPAARYGTCFLYTREAVLAWGRSLISPVSGGSNAAA